MKFVSEDSWELAPEASAITVIEDQDSLGVPPKTFEELADRVKLLYTFAQKAQWLIGDLIIDGMKRFRQPPVPGWESWWIGRKSTQSKKEVEEEYAFFTALSAATGLKKYTLLDIARVAKRIPPGTRVPGVSYSHHREVELLKPEDQKFCLAYAAKNYDMTVRAFHDLVKSRRLRKKGIGGNYRGHQTRPFIGEGSEEDPVTGEDKAMVFFIRLGDFALTKRTADTLFGLAARRKVKGRISLADIVQLIEQILEEYAARVAEPAASPPVPKE
jgi:hypothetical protein